MSSFEEEPWPLPTKIAARPWSLITGFTFAEARVGARAVGNREQQNRGRCELYL
jgi:hypothetical protein